MSKLEDYLRERNRAMLKYPDVNALDQLIRKHPECFDLAFRIRWMKATPYVKLRAMEIMIKSWTEAPESLLKKVHNAEERRKHEGST